MKHLVYSILALYSCFVSAQDIPAALSLDQAIEYALKNNRQSINAQRDIAAAKEQKWETTATGLPQLNANIDYQNFLKQQVSLLPAAAFDPLGSIRPLGDYYDLGDRQIQDLPPAPEGFIPVIFGTQQSMNASATLSQLIFDGSYLVALQSAKVFLEISENAKTKTDLEVRKAVITAYGNVLIAEESVEIIEKNLEVLKKNLDETTKIYENGLEEEESVEQLQITLSGTESSLNYTVRLREIAYQMLNVTLGVPVDSKITLTENLEDLTQDFVDMSLLAADADIESIVEYKIARNDKSAKELMVKLEKSKALPTISSFLNAGYSGFSDSFTFTNSDQNWFGSALLGVNLKIPIFSSFGRTAATNRAEINLEKAKTELEETEQRLRLQINTVKSDYAFAIEDYQNKVQSLRLAERIEQKNEVKFFEGITSSLELRLAQVQLYSAQEEYLQSMLNVITAKAELESLVNQPTLTNLINSK